MMISLNSTKTINEKSSSYDGYTKPHKWKQQRRILLVEDNQITQIIHKKMLIDLGYYVDIASNAAEALSMIDNNYDLVLLDIDLPDKNGIEVCKIARRRACYIPVIALTAESVEIERQCFSVGMNDFIRKPTSKKILKQILERWVPD